MVTTQGMLVELLDLERIEVDIFRGRSPDETCSASSAARWPARLSSPPGGLCRRIVLGTRYMPTSSGPAIPISRSSIPSTASATAARSPRRVVAVQHGRAIFALSASFQVAETDPEYQSLMPEAPDPETVPVMAGATEGVRRPSPGPLAPAAPSRGPLRRRSAVAGAGSWWTTGAAHHGVAASQRDPARRPPCCTCARSPMPVT
jgi:hypothetical protein